MGGSKTRLQGGVGTTERMLPKGRSCLAGKLWIRMIDRKTGENEYKYSIGGLIYFNHNPFVKRILFFLKQPRFSFFFDETRIDPAVSHRYFFIKRM